MAEQFLAGLPGLGAPQSRPPAIADANALSAKCGGADIVIVHFDRASGQFGVTSWGIDRARCATMKSIADQIFDRIESGEIADKHL